MKLKDPGTIISKTVVTQNFKGKEYLMLRATYDKEVGSDVWQFYFDQLPMPWKYISSLRQTQGRWKKHR